MTIFQTIAVAFSMFSAVPMPQFDWNRKNMRYVLLAFPLIGVLIGLVCRAADLLCEWLALPAILRGAVFCVIPFVLTGGIHLDGYADTCDALASHADPVKKQEILKDPHVGSFAVMRICGTFLLTFALWAGLPEYRPVPVFLIFVLSRILSGLAVASFPMAKNSGLAYSFAEAAEKKRVRAVLIILDVLATALLFTCDTPGIAMAAAAHLTFLYYYRMSMKQFGGISGDLAGWFLVEAEKWMLAALAAAEYLEAIL